MTHPRYQHCVDPKCKPCIVLNGVWYCAICGLREQKRLTGTSIPQANKE